MNQKDLRKQLRNVVQEMKDELITQEIIQSIERRLMDYLRMRLDAIDERQKDIQGYMVRQNANMTFLPKNKAE